MNTELDPTVCFGKLGTGHALQPRYTWRTLLLNCNL